MSKPDTDDAARLLGMKASEVLAVADTDDGLVVTTHDGAETLVRNDGSLVLVNRKVDTFPSLLDETDEDGDSEEESVPEPPPARPVKAAARKRASGGR